MDNLFLSSLNIGEGGVIDKVITSNLKIKRRLLELGFVSGTRVSVLSRSSLGEVILVEIIGYCISIRKSLANYIILKK